MFYSDGQKRIIEGMPYTYMAEIHSWRCDNSGRILSEAQIQEMEYMMYSEDGWDYPGLYEINIETGDGSVTIPSKPKPYKKDYSKILVELWGRGGTGGTAGGTGGCTAGGGGGAGGYSYTLTDWSRKTESGITLQYTFDDGYVGFTLGQTAFSVQPGADGVTLTAGAGGTAAGGTQNISGQNGESPTNTEAGAGGSPSRSYYPLNNDAYARFGGAGATETTGAFNGVFFGAGGGGGFSADGFEDPGSGGPAHLRVSFL